MQIYIYYFIRANIFMKKFGVGPDGQDPSSGFGFAPYPLGPQYRPELGPY